MPSAPTSFHGLECTGAVLSVTLCSRVHRRCAIDDLRGLVRSRVSVFKDIEP